MISLMLVAVLGADAEWKKLDPIDGIELWSRPVAGSSVVELKLVTTVRADPQRLCDEAFGKGELDPEEPDLKARTVLASGPDTRLTYDQISPAVVSNRDYAVRATRERLPGNACRMVFAAANEGAPPLPKGFVRITKLKGEWRFEPVEPAGHTRLTYTVHSDPAGSIPAFLVEGKRRTFAVQWVKLITKRASAP